MLGGPEGHPLMARRSRAQRRPQHPVLVAGNLLGASVRTGRDFLFASRNPLLLPRSYAAAIPTGAERYRDLEAIRRRFTRQAPVRRVPVSRQVQRRHNQLLSASRPFLNASQTPCKRRAVRREVVFAQAVAGRRWGNGGPNMFRARRGVSSSYTCRR